MLEAGGSRVTLAGFRRTATTVTRVGDVPAIDLGRTEDGAFWKRMLTVARTARRLSGMLGSARPDIILARNLEMLALVNFVPAQGCPRPRLVYESLDIHRLLLRKDPVGAALRGLERKLLRRASLIITSSPAFVREYFLRVQKVPQPIVLVENKVVELDGHQSFASSEPAPALLSGRPRRIGWFGALRCQKSLHLLAAFSRMMRGRYEIVLRGRPAYRELEDFDRFVADQPFMRFEGPFRSPEDLAAIYREVDLVWAIDFFEEGLNSKWLLPNRLYEGCRHGAVPVAMEGTETAHFLNEHGLGLILPDATPEALLRLLKPLDDSRLECAQDKVAVSDRSLFACSRNDCEALVRRMAAAGGAVGLRETTLKEQAWVWPI